MAERTYPSNSAACMQWEMLLADALDGLLRPQDEALFSTHKSACPACAALFEEARRGREWLEFLSPEPLVPAGLLDKILVRTGPGQMEGFGLAPTGSNVVQMPQPWQRPGFLGSLRQFAEPRLFMTAAMAFFSITLTLNMTGIRLSSVRLASLRPTAVLSFPGEARSYLERRLTMASTPVIRYYDHSRLVYEVESRVRELRRAIQSQDDSLASPDDSAPGEAMEIPGRMHGYTRQDSPQQSNNPARNRSRDALQSSLTLTSLFAHHRPAHSGGSAISVRERSKQWTA